jgi:dissimilatory sulfite reductase (desulfoviridin) alpha/beta subunit
MTQEQFDKEVNEQLKKMTEIGAIEYIENEIESLLQECRKKSQCLDKINKEIFELKCKLFELKEGVYFE